MARIPFREPDEGEDESVHELLDYFHHADGTYSNHFRLEAHVPEVMQHVFRARLALFEDGELPAELMEKVEVAVSMSNGCQYCTGAFCKMLGSDLGSDEVVREFQRAVVAGGLKDLERDVIEFAVTVNEDPHTITDEDVAALRRDHDLSPAALVQLVNTVNVISGYNTITTVFDAEYDHRYPAEWAAPPTDGADAA